MNTKTIFFVGLFGAIVGCAANQAAQVYTVSAQAGADPGQFRECAVYTLSADHDLEDLPGKAKPIAGWTPVGGHPQGVVLCR